MTCILKTVVVWKAYLIDANIGEDHFFRFDQKKMVVRSYNTGLHLSRIEEIVFHTDIRHLIVKNGSERFRSPANAAAAISKMTAIEFKNAPSE